MIDLVSKLLLYAPEKRLKPMEALQHQFFDFCEEEITSTSPQQIKQLIPDWYLESMGLKVKSDVKVVLKMS